MLGYIHISYMGKSSFDGVLADRLSFALLAASGTASAATCRRMLPRLLLLLPIDPRINRNFIDRREQVGRVHDGLNPVQSGSAENEIR